MRRGLQRELLFRETIVAIEQQSRPDRPLRAEVQSHIVTRSICAT
jgi:hypothetical protein